MRRAARTDVTAQPLVTLARQLGARYVHLGGVVDGLLLFHGRVVIVDWKRTQRAERTMRQQRLLTEGWPIAFVSTAAELCALLGVRER